VEVLTGKKIKLMNKNAEKMRRRTLEVQEMCGMVSYKIDRYKHWNSSTFPISVLKRRNKYLKRLLFAVISTLKYEICSFLTMGFLKNFNKTKCTHLKS